jgi:hypothetical protein
LKFFENSPSKEKDIAIQSVTYGLNLFIPTFILILSSLFENYELTAELGILIGVNIIFTQIFSSNARSLIISKKTQISFQSFILFRILISIFVLIINVIIIKYFKFIYSYLLFQLSILIVLQWLNELILTYFEINKKNKEIYSYLFLKVFFLTIIIFNFLFFQNLIDIILIFNLLLFLFFIKYYLKIKKKVANQYGILKVFKNSISSISFYSSFSISFANLLWRVFIIMFCGKILAGIYFAGFAIGSLPGTFFNNSFGPSMIKKNFKLKKILNLFNIMFIILMICLSIYIIKTYQNIFINNFDTQIICTFLSLLGSFLMIKGLYFRQYLIQKTKYQSKVFKTDILYSTLIIFVVPFLYFFGGYKLIIISFLISSIISIVTYGLIYQLYFKK